MCMVAMAAVTLERIAQLREGARGKSDAAPDGLDKLLWIAGGVVGAAVLGLAVASGGGAAATGPTAAAGWGRFLLFAGATTLALWLWTSRRIGMTAVALALAALTLTDLWVVARRFFYTVPPPEATFAADDVTTFLTAQPGPSRMWTFPYPESYRGGGAYGSDFPMHFGIEQVGGEHPNMLQRWNQYVGAGTQTYIDWHNVVRDPRVVETSEGQAIAFDGEEGFLEAANVRYVVSMAPLFHPALREVHRGTALIYEHVNALPRAYLVPTVQPVEPDAMLDAMTAGAWNPREVAFVPAAAGVSLPEGPLQGDAQVLEYEPDLVSVRTTADRPALLVLADNFYEGWRAEIDGEPAEIVRTNHTFRGVVVPQGEHTVRFVFRPDDLYTGMYVTLLGFALLAGYGIFLLARRRRAAEPA
jgi:hypothetical protein